MLADPHHPIREAPGPMAGRLGDLAGLLLGLLNYYGGSLLISTLFIPWVGFHGVEERDVI